jgi:hypothetical protein
MQRRVHFKGDKPLPAPPSCEEKSERSERGIETGTDDGDGEWWKETSWWMYIKWKSGMLEGGRICFHQRYGFQRVGIPWDGVSDSMYNILEFGVLDIPTKTDLGVFITPGRTGK